MKKGLELGRCADWGILIMAVIWSDLLQQWGGDSSEELKGKQMRLRKSDSEAIALDESSWAPTWGSATQVRAGEPWEVNSQGLITDQVFKVKEKEKPSVPAWEAVDGKASHFFSTIHAVCREFNNAELEEVTSESSFLLIFLHLQGYSIR